MAERCLNCEFPIPAGARFCPNCSQRTDTGRLSFSDMTRDLMHSFVNIERGPVVFAWALLTRPGGTAREYVEGRRRRYYGPFATLVVLVGLAALALRLSGFQVLPQLSTQSATVLQEHLNLVVLVQLPLLGAVCALVFPEARLTLPEHMVLVAYTLGMRAVALTVITPIAILLNPTSAVTFWENTAYWAGWYVYFGWAASQFYFGSRWRSWLRGMLVAAIGHALIIGLLVGGNAAYEMTT
ncbi:MAG TPA: DUF3667 domain-containing protein [Burkholderiaceae bacterium]|nr:DUF3667 domain-containing protein [Burkholderiaceae bacterium]